MTIATKSLSDKFSVSSQLTPEDMQEVKASGFNTVIINRPDFEAGADQPASIDVITAGEALGLTVVYQPIISGNMNAENVKQFAQYMQTLPKPILAYCRSGTRCTNLYNAAIQES